LMWYLAKKYFSQEKNVPAEDGEDINRVQKVIYNKYYVDEFYEAVITKPLNKISEFFYSILELRFVDAIVNGIGDLVKWLSSIFRLTQTGNIGFYIFAMVVSIVVILFIKLF